MREEGGTGRGAMVCAHASLARFAARVAEGEGLANLALDCVSADQSDCTGAICPNYIHSFAVALKYWVGQCVK